MPRRRVLHTTLLLLITIAGPAFGYELGRFRVGKSDIMMRVATLPPKGAPSNEAAKPLAARQMSSLSVTFQDHSGKMVTNVSNVEFSAEMPEHSHSMNVKPVTVKEKPGVFRIDGVKLHMPGFWKLKFSVKKSGGVEVVEIPLTI